MSENPKKTFLSTLGKHLVVGSELMPAVQPTPPVEPPVVTPPVVVVPPVAPPVVVAAIPVVTPPTTPPAVPPVAVVTAPVAPVVPPTEPAVKVIPKRHDPLPAIKEEDIESIVPAVTEGPKPVAELLGYQATKAEVRYLEVIQAGAQREPEKFQSIFDREVDRLKKVNEFAVKWREEHPDDELTADVTEYRKFLKANPPAIDSVEHEDLKDELRTEKARALARDDLREEMSAGSRKILEMETRPVIEGAISEVEKTVLAALPEALPKDDYLREVLKDGMTALEKVPGEGRVFATALSRGRNVVSEFIRLRRGISAFDPQNQAHVFISRAIATYGEVFEREGGAERIRNGRRFVQPKDFRKLKPDARDRHWTFTDSELVSVFADSTARGAIQELEERRREDAASTEFKRGKVPSGKASPTPVSALPVSSPSVTPSPASPAAGAGAVKNPRLKAMMGIPVKT